MMMTNRPIIYQNSTHVENHYTTIIETIGVRAQSTLGGHNIFARKKICITISKRPEFYMILARKLAKYPKFL